MASLEAQTLSSPIFSTGISGFICLPDTEREKHGAIFCLFVRHIPSLSEKFHQTVSGPAETYCFVRPHEWHPHFFPEIHHELGGCLRLQAANHPWKFPIAVLTSNVKFVSTHTSIMAVHLCAQLMSGKTGV
jgi:hypothetical protein